MNLEDKKLIEKLLEFQELDTQISIVLKKLKNCKSQYQQVDFNKKLGLPINSKVGLLMALSKEVE